MKSWALPGKGRQKGAALLIFAVFLVSAVLAVFLKHLNRQGSGFADEARDGEVLLQAKEALIGFAAALSLAIALLSLLGPYRFPAEREGGAGQ